MFKYLGHSVRSNVFHHVHKPNKHHTMIINLCEGISGAKWMDPSISI